MDGTQRISVHQLPLVGQLCADAQLVLGSIHVVQLQRVTLPRDFALLEFLMKHKDEVFSSDALLQRVWDSDSEATSEALRTAIKRIRKKIDTGEDEGASLIENIPRIGYRMRG